MNKINSIKLYYFSLFLVTHTICSCNQDIVENNTSNDIIKVEADIENINSTRAVRLSSSNLSQFGVYSFYNGVARAKNTVFNKTNNVWKGDRVMTWAAGSMDFYGISPNFKISSTYNATMAATPKHVDYNVPTNADKQIDIMYSSVFNLSKDDNNGSLVFAYKPAMHYMNFTGTNALESNYQVFVKSLIVHNLISNGTFNYSTTSANVGNWTTASDVNAIYVNDTINLKEVTELTLVKKSLMNDEYLILMPQTTTKWATTDASPIPISTADENHNYYIEVIGQIIRTEDDGSKTYLLGNPDDTTDPEHPQYESVYFPQAGRTYRIGAGSTLPITFNGGYNKNGETYLDHTDRSGNGVIVKVSEWEPSDFNIEEWTPYYENIEL